MINKILIGTLCAIAVSACVAENDSSSNFDRSKPLTKTGTLKKIEDEEKIPKLERVDSVAGIDNDKNGIRDDIDAYILKHYPMEEQRKAVSQFAKSFQAYLVTDTKDNIVVKEISNENTRAMTCVFSKFNNSDIGPNGSVIKEIINLTTNTKMRLLAYHEFNDALDGTVISIPKKDYCNE